MLPLYLFNGVITNQQERIEFVGKMLNMNIPLNNNDRRTCKNLLERAEGDAERALHREIRELKNE